MASHVPAKRPANFSWVITDELSGTAFPSHPEHVQYLVEQGIKHIVSLTKERQPPVKGFEDKINLICDFKMPDFTSPSLEMVDKFVELVDQCRLKKEPLVVHCMHGQGRTGTLLACYLIKENKLSGDGAIQEIRRLRPRSIETAEQEEIIRQYAKHMNI